MYGDNHQMMPTTRALLARIRCHLDTAYDEPCQLTADDIVARGLASLARDLGVSDQVCAADIRVVADAPVVL